LEIESYVAQCDAETVDQCLSIVTAVGLRRDIKRRIEFVQSRKRGAFVQSLRERECHGRDLSKHLMHPFVFDVIETRQPDALSPSAES
jgi:hypothetical protein